VKCRSVKCLSVKGRSVIYHRTVLSIQTPGAEYTRGLFVALTGKGRLVRVEHSSLFPRSEDYPETGFIWHCAKDAVVTVTSAIYSDIV
jgi:hypothetical protein